DCADCTEAGDCADCTEAGDCADSAETTDAALWTDCTLALCTSWAAARSRAVANAPLTAGMLVPDQVPTRAERSWNRWAAADRVLASSAGSVPVITRCSLSETASELTAVSAQLAAAAAPPTAATAVEATTMVQARDFFLPWWFMVLAFRDGGRLR